MSTVTPKAIPISAAPLGITRARSAIISAFLALGALAVAATVLWQPMGERNQIGYADIAS
jgi:hypothetical protein